MRMSIASLWYCGESEKRREMGLSTLKKKIKGDRYSQTAFPKRLHTNPGKGGLYEAESRKRRCEATSKFFLISVTHITNSFFDRDYAPGRIKHEQDLKMALTRIKINSQKKITNWI